METDFRKRTESLFNSLKRKETFSKEIQEQIESELEKMKKQAIEFNKKKGKESSD